jgi:hypothetical protein
MMVIFLGLLLAGMAPASEPTIPLGCTPNFIQTRKRSFWGIVLDDDLVFESESQTLTIPFDFVRRFGCSGVFHQYGMQVELVDGSKFEEVRLVAPTEFRLATLAGIQRVPFEINKANSKPSRPAYKEKVIFHSPTISQVERLRIELQRALNQNAATITQIIGSDVLEAFFNIKQI